VGLTRLGTRCENWTTTPSGWCGRCAGPAGLVPESAVGASGPVGWASSGDPLAAGLGRSALLVGLLGEPAGVEVGDVVSSGPFAGVVVTDRVDGDTVLVFRMGGCHVMAAVLAEETGWPVVAVGAAGCDGGCVTAGREDRWDAEFGEGGEVLGSPEWCDCRIRHFAVEAPDGMVWDVAGEHDPAGWADDGDDEVVVRVPPAVFARVLEGWGDESQMLAGWARLLAPRVLSGDGLEV